MHSETKSTVAGLSNMGVKGGGSIWEYHLYIPPSMLILGPLNGHRIRFGPQHFFFSAHVRKYEFAERAVDLLHQTKSVSRFVRAEVM